MTNLRDILLDKIVEMKIAESIKDQRVSPVYSDLHNASATNLNSVFSLNNIPKIAYKSELNSNEYDKNISYITGLINALSKNIKDLESAYKARNKAYELMENKINKSIRQFQKSIDVLSNFSCYKILNDFSKQTERSYAGKIGKFVTLPFFVGNVSMYSGNCYIGVTASGDVNFSNLSYISALPLDRKPSMKIKSDSDIIDITITVTVDETTSNMIYVKFDNDITNMVVDIVSNGTTLNSNTFKDNEAIVNYLPILMDTVRITISVPNQNTDKPLSIRMSEFNIFSNIKFSKKGIFESVPEKINNPTTASYVSLSYINTGDTTNTQTNPMISISSDNMETKYNMIDVGQDVDITLDKFKYAKEFQYSSLAPSSILDRDYKSYTITDYSNEWELDFKSAIVVYGLNKDLLTSDRATKGFDNWTLSGNYYKTSILNYEDNVSVNTGSSTIVINGKECRGNVTIPVGISEIAIHTKDVDFSVVDMLIKSTVQNPFNFAYLFTGLPEYNNGGTLSPADKKAKTFNVVNTGCISLNEPFMPFSEEVTDEYGNVYKLALTEMPYAEGTYTILPNSGTVYISPFTGSRTINVLYYKASTANRPAGILFNRLLTFASLPNLLSLKEQDNTIFSFGGTDTERYLILPSIPNITNSQLLYNLDGDNLYFSTQIQMITNNSYLTPILNNIYLSVK